ncbi:hydrogen peroxide-inducible genes activator [Marinobacterium aestuariivivens]|uniref:Hydrogen peroxide-inducible genes activator n=1 Tax=Marinobacterium aestuariivivens TaxID=1698799 RepID=A0ABW1ZVU8_9GAMM
MTHPPTLKQLKYLCAVAEHLHFGRAARACYVSQSTLSAGIQELEEHLGVVLLERNSKRVLLTEVGREAVARSHQILNAVEDLAALCERSALPLSGRMRMGVIPTIAPYLLPRLLQRLRAEHPAFQLFIREDLSQHLVDALQQGDLDLLLLAIPFPAEGVETLHLFDDDFVLAYPPRHPLGALELLHTRDLQGQDLLLLEEGHCLRGHALAACRLNSGELSVPYQATSLNTLVQMVANGIGVTLLPRMALDTPILAGTGVRTKRFAEAGVRRSIGLMWRRQAARSEEFRLLGEFIRQHGVPPSRPPSR